MAFVKRLRERLEAALTAAAFAEESELDTARRIVARPPEADPPRGSAPR